MIGGTIESIQVDTANSDVPFYIGVDNFLMLNTSEARNRGITVPSSFDVVLNVTGSRTNPRADTQSTPYNTGYFHAVVELPGESK